MTDEKSDAPSSGNGSPSPQNKTGLLSFGLSFVKKPAMLGSVIPSSRYLVRRTLALVDWSRADLVIEYGPGVGTFTGEILHRMPPEGKLLAFETHPDFVQHLKASLPDPRLEVIHGSAEEVEATLRERGQAPADYVLSGIPFSLMPGEVRSSILRSTRAVLDPDGAMLVYQFSPTIGSHLKNVFSEVHWQFEPRNFLPAMVFHCQP